MGYQIVTPASSPSAGPAVPSDGICVSTRRAPKRGDLYARFEIGPTAAQHWAWAEGDQLELAWGTGADHGKLRLRRLSTGRGFALRRDRRAGHLAFSVPHRLLPADFADAEFRRARCPHEAIEPTAREDAVSVFLTLPRGFLERVS